MKLINRLLTLPCLFLICLVAANAQTYRGTVRGTVRDPSEALVPGAEIKLTNQATNETRTAQSNYDGEYSISSLRPGQYRVDITAQGFASAQQTVNLSVDQELRVNIVLVVSGDQFSVDVASGLKQDSASLGTVIENKQVTGLPLDGRNFYELTLLVPGAVPALRRRG